VNQTPAVETPLTAEPPRNRRSAHCRHCGSHLPATAPTTGRFCCTGCEAAYALIHELGLDGYYRRRTLDPAQRTLKPEEGAATDYVIYVRDDGGGILSLNLMIEGLHCAACVWLIESVLTRQPAVVSARVNMTTRRLLLRWRTGDATATELAALVTALGYRLVPYDPALIDQETTARERELLRALAVAGFAAGNVMLLSISVWAGHLGDMGPATRGLMHWLSALIALPAIAYSGRPFFRSALAVLRARRVNMDVPISLAVILAPAMSLHETVVGAPHAYFDSAVALLFFLLIGRYLDRRARGRARSTAEQLLILGAAAVTVIGADGRKRLLPPREVVPGMQVTAAAGDRIAVDGRIVDGRSDIDTSLINGETLPVAAGPGTRVFAGTLNLSGPLVIVVEAVGERTLLAEIARLVEAAEQGSGRYVAIADRVARLYAPVVHSAAALTFLGWWLLAAASWQASLLNAIAVLIITCPCALALAVPVVCVIATGRLLRQGILVKSATALERLAAVDTIVFDKTGTLTEGRAELSRPFRGRSEDLRFGAAMAEASRHPLARALVRAAEAAGVRGTPCRGVREIAGSGLETDGPTGPTRLGSRAFCRIAEDAGGDGPELWLTKPGEAPVQFSFVDPPRVDARSVVSLLQIEGFQVLLASGDREAAVGPIAAAVGIDTWRAGMTPAGKCEFLRSLAASERKVLMVGDGLNDAPALATASASMSPSTAVDLTQTAADVVFQGARLAAVGETLTIARRAMALIRQNFVLAFLYNAVTVPIAVAGLVTPLVAAVAMSASSLLVILNALRLNRGKPWTSSSI
jgi:Cu2+-exporting ATPase